MRPPITDLLIALAGIGVLLISALVGLTFALGAMSL
ncbi:hypothetical protein Uis4E_1554 [Bifidobacterium parmae]|uniref:Uncharacterized protein n=1 Tax=Bifidobacterium parmae TaxID=361854 RepID=A0A2N5IZY3_9BIFI|nr:hypothetical protein Uis4E_1554 [Bifidobacterium parmae]